MRTTMTMNSRYVDLIEKELRVLFESNSEKYPSELSRAVEYALFPGGKRVRPYLSLLTADFVNVPIKKIMPLACSIELIHNYSLIHDDLPCMDYDLVRRGKPSCFAAFGESTALLAGDCLLNLAYEVLFGAVQSDPDLAQSAKIIAERAGGSGMIGGQTIELTNDRFDESLITDLCQKKTGALIDAAIMSVAVLSSERKKISALSTYSSCVGFIFQLVDDLLDEWKGEEKSYLSVMGKENTIKRIDRLTELLNLCLSPFGKEAEQLLEFGNFLSDRKA